MSSVHYKFKSSIEYDTVTFDGLSISLADLKKAICAQKKITRAEFDLQITNAQNGEEYSNNDDLIPKNASVVIVRVPIGGLRANITAEPTRTDSQQKPVCISRDDAHFPFSLSKCYYVVPKKQSRYPLQYLTQAVYNT